MVQSEAAEQALLMCLIRAPKVWGECQFSVKRELFSYVTTQKLYDIVVEWIDTVKENINLAGYEDFIAYCEIQYSEWFNRNKEYLRECSNKIIDSDQAEEKWKLYQNILEKFYVFSVTNDVIEKSKEKMINSPLEIKSHIQELQTDLNHLFSGTNFSDNTSDLSSVIENYRENIIRRLDKEYSPCYFGLRHVDEGFGGFFPNTYSLITARSSVGKSALVQTAAKNMLLKQDKKVAVFNLEMDNFDFLTRWFSQDLKINSLQIRDPKSLTKDQRKELFKLQEDLLLKYKEQLHLIDDMYDVSQIIDKILQLYKLYGLDVVFVDLIEYVSAKKHLENRTRELAYISNEFFRLRKQIDISIIMIQQQNKTGDVGGTQASGRGSEDPFIQSDVSIGLFKYQNDDGTFDPDRRILNVMKNRHGSTDSYTIKFNKDLTMFEDDFLGGTLE